MHADLACDVVCFLGLGLIIWGVRLARMPWVHSAATRTSTRARAVIAYPPLEWFQSMSLLPVPAPLPALPFPPLSPSVTTDILVDPLFLDAFQQQPSSPTYDKLLAGLPRAFVGTAAELKQLVALLTAQSMKAYADNVSTKGWDHGRGLVSAGV